MPKLRSVQETPEMSRIFTDAVNVLLPSELCANTPTPHAPNTKANVACLNLKLFFTGNSKWVDVEVHKASDFLDLRHLTDSLGFRVKSVCALTRIGVA